MRFREFENDTVVKVLSGDLKNLSRRSKRLIIKYMRASEEERYNFCDCLLKMDPGTEAFCIKIESMVLDPRFMMSLKKVIEEDQVRALNTATKIVVLQLPFPVNYIQKLYLVREFSSSVDSIKFPSDDSMRIRFFSYKKGDTVIFEKRDSDEVIIFEARVYDAELVNPEKIKVIPNQKIDDRFRPDLIATVYRKNIRPKK